MNDNSILEVCSKAVNTYGTEAQIWMAIEEMAELSDALAKYHRNRATREHVCEEIADVIIMMIQMAAIFGPDKAGDYLESKLERLDKRLAKHKEKDSQGDI